MTFESDVATGTAPFTIASTTLVSNLNSDLLDGQHGSYYLNITSVLDDLADVDTSGAAQDQVLAYNSSSGTWTPAIVSGVEELSDLNDVDTSGANADDILIYNPSSGTWLPNDLNTFIENNTEIALNTLHRTEVSILNGFEDGEGEVTESFTNGTRTLQLIPTGANYSYWSDGIKYTKTTETCQ